MNIQTTVFPPNEWTVMSPYPTVLIVTITKYNESMNPTSLLSYK